MAGAGNSALGTVADTVNGKSEEGDNTERAFNTPRFGMKLQKFSVNGTNSTGKPTAGSIHVADWSKRNLNAVTKTRHKDRTHSVNSCTRGEIPNLFLDRYSYS